MTANWEQRPSSFYIPILNWPLYGWENQDTSIKLHEYTLINKINGQFKMLLQIWIVNQAKFYIMDIWQINWN